MKKILFLNTYCIYFYNIRKLTRQLNFYFMNSIEKEQSLKSLHKVIFGFVPGNHVITEIAEFHNKIYQTRLNKFSELLFDSLKEYGELQFDVENIKNESFIDAFEIIIRKVARTGKEEKLNRLKNILLRQVYKADDNELFLVFSDYIDQINETQFKILDTLYSLYYYYPDGRPLFGDIFRTGPRRKNALVGDNVYYESINEEKFHISKSQLSFYISDLNRKQLIKFSSSFNKKEEDDNTLKNRYEITLIGMELVHFVSEYIPKSS